VETAYGSASWFVLYTKYYWDDQVKLVKRAVGHEKNENYTCCFSTKSWYQLWDVGMDGTTILNGSWRNSMWGLWLNSSGYGSAASPMTPVMNPRIPGKGDNSLVHVWLLASEVGFFCMQLVWLPIQRILLLWTSADCHMFSHFCNQQTICRTVYHNTKLRVACLV
jgi:hypothetical protein